MKRFTVAVLGLLGVFGLFELSQAADPPSLKPSNLAFNTRDDEDEPHVASNGLTIYFTTKLKDKDPAADKTKNTDKFGLKYATRATTKNAWSSSVTFTDYFGGESDVRGVFVSPEGVLPQVIYFGTHTPDPDSDMGKGNWDISYGVRDRVGRGFGPTRPLVTVDSPLDELHPWLMPQAKEIYFSRKTSDGWRVFMATRTNPKDTKAIPSFGEPALIKELPADFYHATLTPDGNTMYLQGPLEENRLGLFQSMKGKDGWSKPAPLDGLNHPGGKTGDRSPNLSRDGALLYFASDRPEGKGGLDIWVIPTKDLVKKK